MGLTDRVAIVTGGGRGIGEAIAHKLAQSGAKVVICARSQEEIDHTSGVIQEQGGRAAAIRADISNPEDVKRVVEGAAKVFGPPTILVNNAGNYIYKSLGDTSLEDWNQTMGVSLTGPYFLSQAVLPHMRKAGGGCIVNIASLFGTEPKSKNLSAYCAAKAGLIGLTKALAHELRGDHITVNAVCPGAVNKKDELDGERYKFGEHLLPRDVAEAVAFLCSDGASQISGVSLEVAGGTGFECKVHAM